MSPRVAACAGLRGAPARPAPAPSARRLDTAGGHVSSNGHRVGRIDFADLQSGQRYGRMTAYAQSKLANLMYPV